MLRGPAILELHIISTYLGRYLLYLVLFISSFLLNLEGNLYSLSARHVHKIPHCSCSMRSKSSQIASRGSFVHFHQAYPIYCVLLKVRSLMLQSFLPLNASSMLIWNRTFAEYIKTRIRKVQELKSESSRSIPFSAIAVSSWLPFDYSCSWIAQVHFLWQGWYSI